MLLPFAWFYAFPTPHSRPFAVPGRTLREMTPLRCPCCGAVLSAKVGDKWEVIRMFVAVHLRTCDQAPSDEKEARRLAIRVADEVIADRGKEEDS